MAVQSELDLPAPDAPPPQKPKPNFYAGLSRSQAAASALLLAAVIWGVWVTKELIAPRQERIVAARLSSIVGEYVQAQARSPAPPAQVEVEMRQFLASLDHELQRRSDHGEVVLVGEAVLTKNVPDITDALKKAVYASGVALPAPAGVGDLRAVGPAAAAPSAPAAALQEPALRGAFGDEMAVPQIPGVPEPGSPPSGAPGASVSTFGGVGDNAGQ